ncbi:hypothetical protein [Streptomyces griseoflavus]|uniref:hypothetical protein n=1 Tax=Streptomyces griseoflavus TaxID=35619 RepID=UPI003D7309B2
MSHFRVRITDDRLAEIDGTPLVPAPGESVHDAVLDRLQRHAQERAAAVRATVNDGPDTGHFLLEISPDGSSRLLDASTPEPPAPSVPPQSPEPSQVPEPSQTPELLQIPGPSQPSAPSDAPAAPHLAQPPTPAEPTNPAEPPSAPAMSLSGPAEVSVSGPAVSGSGAAESAEDRAVPPSGPGESVSGSAVPPSDPAGVPAAGPAPRPAPLTSALSAAVTRARATAASHAVPAPDVTIPAPQPAPASMAPDVTTPAPQAPPASMAPEVPTPAPPAAAPVGGLAGDVAERIGRINAEAAAGRLDEAYADATTLRESLAETVGADHPHAVEARALEAYLAHLCGDHREATVLALGVARIRCVNGDERAPSDVARAAAAWQHIEDDRAAAVHGTELLHMWDTLRDLGTLTAGQAELAERTREQVEALLAHV